VTHSLATVDAQLQTGGRLQ